VCASTSGDGPWGIGIGGTGKDGVGAAHTAEDDVSGLGGVYTGGIDDMVFWLMVEENYDSESFGGDDKR